MFLTFLLLIVVIVVDSCIPTNTASGTFGSTCNNITLVNGVYTPSSECGYNYVCNTDNNFCGTSLVCTTVAGSSNVQNAAGLPCKVDSDCGGNGYFCAQLNDTTTQSQMWSFWYFTQGNGVVLQTPFSSSGIYPGTSGVCVCAPGSLAPTASALAGHPYSTVSNPKCCSSHTDCKFRMYVGTTWVGGNDYGNYMCSSTGGSMCRQVASCHPVTHQCEAPLDTPQTGVAYYNSNCAGCTNACGTNSSSWNCGSPSNDCCTQARTCKSTGLYPSC